MFFVSSRNGAKNYAIDAEGGKKICKVRGFTLKSRKAKENLNLEKMAQLQEKWVKGEDDSITASTSSMKVDRLSQTIVNRTLVKKYTNHHVSNKRPLRPDGKWGSRLQTVPYGCKGPAFVDIPEEFRD